MRKGNRDSLRRRNLMFPESFDADIAEIRELISAQSDSEVLRRAFMLYKRLLDPNIKNIEVTYQSGEKCRIILA